MLYLESEGTPIKKDGEQVVAALLEGGLLKVQHHLLDAPKLSQPAVHQLLLGRLELELVLRLPCSFS